MALPAGLTKITVTGTFLDSDGSAVTPGSVLFAPTVPVMDAAGQVVISAVAVVATLNSSGQFSVVLPCTDNAGLVPLGWQFGVTISVPGAQAQFTCFLPSALGPTVDITALAPALGTPAPSGVAYLPSASNPPVAGPSLGGGFLFAESGNLFWLPGSGGPVLLAGSGSALPLTTFGDTLYENSVPAPARLPGNKSATKNFLTQTGTGTVSAAPAWGTIAASDIPGPGDWLNVKTQYGAKGDGVADDTGAIQNALNAAGLGQAVYCPYGTYKTTASLTIPSGAALIGPSSSFGMPEGNYGSGGLPVQGAIIAPASTFARAFSGTGVILMDTTSGQGGGQRIENISIDGTNAPNGNNLHGIAIFDAVACVTLEDILIYGANGQLGGDGLHAARVTSGPPDLLNIYRCHFAEMGGWGVSLNGSADSYIVTSECTGNSSGGWNITNCNNARFVGAKGEQSKSGPGWLFTALSGFTGIVHLVACTSQGNNTDGFKVTGAGTGTYQMVSCSADSDGVNGGSAGGGYAGLNVTSFAGAVLADGWNTRVTGSPASPQYGVSMTSSGTLQMAGAVLAGATSPVNNGGGNTTFNAGTVPGQFLCAVSSYAPGSLTTLTAAGTTFAALSSGNVNTGSFTAPASGNVLVTASFVLNQQTATTIIGFALAAHGTVTPLVSNIVQGTPANTSTYFPVSVQFLVTGLTAGTSYNFDLLAATNSGSDAINIPAQSLTGTTLTAVKAAPVVMTVQAA